MTTFVECQSYDPDRGPCAERASVLLVAEGCKNPFDDAPQWEPEVWGFCSRHAPEHLADGTGWLPLGADSPELARGWSA